MTYKFVAGENKTFDKVKIGGLARIFDFNGNPANFTVLVSTDNSDWTPFKEYSPLNLQDGGEKVSLGYQGARNTALPLPVICACLRSSYR